MATPTAAPPLLLGPGSRPLLKPGSVPSSFHSIDDEAEAVSTPGATPATAVCIDPEHQLEELREEELQNIQALRRRNVRICMWINYMTTVTTVMAMGPFLDIYIYQVTGSNQGVGNIESIRGVAQLFAAPVLGVLTDRMDRYRLGKVAAVLRAIPIVLLGLVIWWDMHHWLYLAVPLLAISNHLGTTLRGALLSDNLPEGPERMAGLSQNFSATYLGQATGPLLQLAVLFARGGHTGWDVKELRVAIIAGCFTYIVAEPLSFWLSSVPPAPPGPEVQSAALKAEQEDWRDERVLRRSTRIFRPCCFRLQTMEDGVSKRWAIPLLVEATFLVCIFGSGISVKFFPLFFTKHFSLTPLWLCMITAAEPLGVAALSQLNPAIIRRLGRGCAAITFMTIAPALLVAVATVPTFWAVAPIFVLRTATARAYIPIYQAIVASCVPEEHRGKFAALSAFRMSFFSASAFIGGWMADRWQSYVPAMMLTAVWQLVPCTLMFIPVVAWLPRRHVGA